MGVKFLIFFLFLCGNEGIDKPTRKKFIDKSMTEKFREKILFLILH